MDKRLIKAIETIRLLVMEKGTQEQKEAFNIIMGAFNLYIN